MDNELIQDLFEKLSWDYDTEYEECIEIGNGIRIQRVWQISNPAKWDRKDVLAGREQDACLADVIECAIARGWITESDVENLL